jgi:hypothetical protein
LGLQTRPAIGTPTDQHTAEPSKPESHTAMPSLPLDPTYSQLANDPTVTEEPASPSGRPGRLASRAAVDELLALVEGFIEPGDEILYGRGRDR